ncbi:nucleolar protein 14-like [Zingiber officinale]|uniref:nucleolar protein 14-like n=1 Tax=Zingiber officinale TaxID=94328 RepID=UPI001C4CCA45|nr:nucleolar protein 14-like [Zingiber officinale]
MAKTTGRSNTSSKKEKKKKKGSKRFLSGPGAAAMKASKPVSVVNPFESIWSRRKFDVLRKRRKGEERRIGLARSLAIEKRKKTLLKEYEQSAKSSVFLDRRIGEKDDTLQEFNKQVLRLQRERQLKLKKSRKYNLSDDEEDAMTLNQLLSSDRDDFEEEVPPADDLDADIDNHNGSTSSRRLSLNSLPKSSELGLPDEEDEEAHKSKKQVMAEVISKSKFYKAQKAVEKEEDASLLAKLDEDFSTIAQTKALRSLSHPSKMKSLDALLNKGIQREHKEGSFGLPVKESNEKPDEYDKLVKELGSDRRAHASDRTKTPEEIAQEEKERLEELEKQRCERMHATDDSSDEGASDDEDIQSLAKTSRPTSGDDLGDSFSGGKDLMDKRCWVDNINEQNDTDNQDETGSSSQDSEGDEDDEDSDGNPADGDNTSGDECGKISMVRDWEQSDDDELDMNDEEAENHDSQGASNCERQNMDLCEVNAKPAQRTNASPKLATDGGKEIPYVIEAPKTMTELCSLLDNRSDDEVLEIIVRIRAYNSIRLAAENRKKMQIFYGILLQYFAVLATQHPINIKTINLLVKPLVEMSAETPYFAAICARQRLIQIRTCFLEDIRNPDKSCWPTLKTLLLLRLWSLVFPCSDFRHVVMTPMLLLMCEYLMRCPIKSSRDATVGSFLCSMVLSVSKQSGKFCPEALIFLQTLLASSLEIKPGFQQFPQVNRLMETRILEPWLHIGDPSCVVHPLDFYAVMEMQEVSPFFASDEFRASMLLSVLETLKGFVIIYERLSSFPEIFLPVCDLLQQAMQNSNLPRLLRDKMQEVFDLIKKKTDDHQISRQPLQMRKQKPVPMKLLNPKFEENFVRGRDYDPDRERVEMKKLKKLLKSEKKGAIRELRKDSQFMSGLKESARLMQEEERAERYRKSMAFLQEQEHAFKSGQLGKGKGSKGKGSKRKR